MISTKAQARKEFDKYTDNLVNSYLHKFTKSYVNERICEGLRQCIEQHGPITKRHLGSAVKRIFASLEGNNTYEALASRLNEKGKA